MPVPRMRNLKSLVAQPISMSEEEARELSDLTLELRDRGVKWASKARVVRVALAHLRRSKTVTEIGELINQLPASRES